MPMQQKPLSIPSLVMAIILGSVQSFADLRPAYAAPPQILVSETGRDQLVQEVQRQMSEQPSLTLTRFEQLGVKERGDIQLITFTLEGDGSLGSILSFIHGIRQITLKALSKGKGEQPLISTRALRIQGDADGKSWLGRFEVKMTFAFLPAGGSPPAKFKAPFMPTPPPGLDELFSPVNALSVTVKKSISDESGDLSWSPKGICISDYDQTSTGDHALMRGFAESHEDIVQFMLRMKALGLQVDLRSIEAREVFGRSKQAFDMILRDTTTSHDALLNDGKLCVEALRPLAPDHAASTRSAPNASTTPVEALTIVAIVGLNTPMVILQDLEGNQYTLSVGDHIGRENGEIKKIENNSIDIWIRDGAGEVAKNLTLKMPMINGIKIE